MVTAGHAPRTRSSRSRDQTDKRAHLIAATVALLREEGVARCTTRAIASRAGMSTSTVHYYFDDVSEIVELAFRQIIEDFLARLRDIADAAPDPETALRAASAAYLRIGMGRGSGERAGATAVPMLWFEYQVAASRAGNTTVVDQLIERALAFFGSLISQLGVDDPARTTRVYFSCLLGSVARASSDPRSVERILEDVAPVLGLPSLDAPTRAAGREA